MPKPLALSGTCVPSPQSKSVTWPRWRNTTAVKKRPGIGIMPPSPSTITSTLSSVNGGLVVNEDGRGVKPDAIVPP